MPVKTKPVSGQSSWGNVLNTHLEQLIPNSGGGINTFDIFTDRPIYKAGTSTPLDADDVGLTYLFTQTGNLHRFTWNTSLNNNTGGGEWKVLNESLINVKDYGAVGDGVADDTVAINFGANFARANDFSLFIPSGKFLVSSSLNFDNMRVFGSGNTSKIIANNNQFNLIEVKNNFYCQNLHLHGGWDGITTGQKGDVINANPGVIGNTTVLSFGANIFIENVVIRNAKENGIYLTSLGYSSVKSTDIRACGANGLYLYGKSGTESITTIDINNSCVFNDCPNGYGVVISNGIRINISTATIEYTKGIKIEGNDNRSINIENCYQENTNGGKFVTLAGSGIGLNISNCFCSGTSIDYTPNFLGVTLFNNSLLGLPDNPYNWTAQHNPQNQAYTINKLKTLLGADLDNRTGGSPAHIFNTSALSGLDKNIVEFKNAGVTKFSVNSEGGITMSNSTWDGSHITMGNYHLWIDSAGKLRIKNGQPISDLDGSIVGT